MIGMVFGLAESGLVCCILQQGFQVGICGGRDDYDAGSYF